MTLAPITVILDELGYLPFSGSGGALLFHLLRKLYERTNDHHDESRLWECPALVISGGQIVVNEFDK